MKRSEKPIFVDNLTSQLKSAKSVVLVNFAGLTVSAQQELKKRLKKVGATLGVVKNTLFKRAGEAAKIDKEALSDTVLTGQTALVVASDDPISPIQTLGKFAKEFASGTGSSVPKLKVGIVEGIFQDTQALNKLSLLPGRDTLLGQLLAVLMTPSYGLVGALNANLEKLVYLLGEASRQ